MLTKYYTRKINKYKSFRFDKSSMNYILMGGCTEYVVDQIPHGNSVDIKKLVEICVYTEDLSRYVEIIYRRDGSTGTK
jgi:hypothetical protein